jgi:hypothetical protein
MSHVKIAGYTLCSIWMITVLRAFFYFNRKLEKLLDTFKIKLIQ